MSSLYWKEMSMVDSRPSLDRVVMVCCICYRLVSKTMNSCVTPVKWRPPRYSYEPSILILAAS